MSKKFWSLIVILVGLSQSVAAEPLLMTCPSVETLKLFMSRTDRTSTVFPTAFDPHTQTLHMTLFNDWIITESDMEQELLGLGHFQLFISPIGAVLGENIKEKAQSLLSEMRLTHQEIGDRLICSYTSLEHTVQATFIAAADHHDEV